MNLQLRDKVVLISGGAKGIGAATVRALSEESAIPVIVDRDAEAGEKLRDDLIRSGNRCFLIVADLASAESCAGSVKQAVQEYGQLDVLINNAGINDRVGLEHGN